jgi:hypothetical protein
MGIVMNDFLKNATSQGLVIRWAESQAMEQSMNHKYTSGGIGAATTDTRVYECALGAYSFSRSWRSFDTSFASSKKM